MKMKVEDENINKKILEKIILIKNYDSNNILLKEKEYKLKLVQLDNELKVLREGYIMRNSKQEEKKMVDATVVEKPAKVAKVEKVTKVPKAPKEVKPKAYDYTKSIIKVMCSKGTKDIPSKVAKLMELEPALDKKHAGWKINDALWSVRRIEKYPKYAGYTWNEDDFCLTKKDVPAQ